MTDLQVIQLKKDQYTLWDDLVDKSSYATIFHGSKWLETCSKLLGKDLKIYGCFKKDELIGGCSFFTYKKGLFKIASSRINLTPYGGIVLAESEGTKVREKEKAYSKIIQSLFSSFEKENCKYVQLDNPPGFVDVRPFTWKGWDSKLQYTYNFDLKNDIEKSVSKKVRNTVRKAEKNNLKLKKEINSKAFYDLYSMTYKRQNIKPPVNKEFFDGILDLIKNQKNGEMYIAQTSKGENAGTEIIVWDNKRAYRWAAASHSDLKDTGATSFLLFEIFKDLKKKDFKEISLMAANTPHLAKFISSFNPDLVPYYQVIKKSRLVKLLDCIK